MQGFLEKKAGDRQKEFAAALDRHEQWMAHFESKLDALTNILMKREGGPEMNQYPQTQRAGRTGRSGPAIPATLTDHKRYSNGFILARYALVL